MQPFPRKNHHTRRFQDDSSIVSDDSWGPDRKKHKELNDSRTIPGRFHMEIIRKTNKLLHDVIEY